MLKKIISAFCLSLTIFSSTFVNATIVQFQTSLGSFEVNLYDQTTPLTVDNFLSYVESGAYDNTYIHRSVANFIIQGGGFTYNETSGVGENIPEGAAVANEPVYSNRRGTIAMAKIGGNPNSATTEWFVNLANNNLASLDVQNGGFTVFGEVIGDGMDILDAIEALRIFNFSSIYSALPLRNYGDKEVADQVAVTDEHLVMITSIVVLNAAEDTAADLTPLENTLIDQVPSGEGSDSGSGGGAFRFETIFLFAYMVFWSRRKGLGKHLRSQAQ